MPGKRKDKGQKPERSFLEKVCSVSRVTPAHDSGRYVIFLSAIGFEPILNRV